MSMAGAIGAVLLAVLVGIGQFGLHKVPEGAVGVYYRGGAILQEIAEPGYHMMMPFVTRVQPMQVNIQTDLVRDIPCGTQGGTVIHFEKIEVVNRLRCVHVGVRDAARVTLTGWLAGWLADVCAALAVAQAGECADDGEGVRGEL
jgi:regulator of protease activity HflC (stomatin/prohibitin superfamily)